MWPFSRKKSESAPPRRFPSPSEVPIQTQEEINKVREAVAHSFRKEKDTKIRRRLAEEWKPYTAYRDIEIARDFEIHYWAYPHVQSLVIELQSAGWKVRYDVIRGVTSRVTDKLLLRVGHPNSVGLPEPFDRLSDNDLRRVIHGNDLPT